MRKLQVAVAVDEAGTQQSVENFDIIPRIFFIDQVDNNALRIGYQNIIRLQYFLSAENMAGCKFPVQFDWLIYRKFAAFPTVVGMGRN